MILARILASSKFGIKFINFTRRDPSLGGAISFFFFFERGRGSAYGLLAPTSEAK